MMNRCGYGIGRNYAFLTTPPSPRTTNFDRGRPGNFHQPPSDADDVLNLHESIELSVKCKNLPDRDVFSRSDPICVLYMSDSRRGPWKYVGRTERIVNTLSPEFITKFRLYYYFERIQYLKFQCDYAKYSYHDCLGSAIMTLGEVMSASGGAGLKMNMKCMDDDWPYKYNASITVRATPYDVRTQLYTIQLSAYNLDRKDLFGSSDPFFQLYRINDDTSRSLVYRSEVIPNQLNPTWRAFRVSRQEIGDVANRQLELVCFDHDRNGGHDLIGSAITSFDRLRTGGNGPDSVNDYELVNEKKLKRKGYRNSGVMHLLRFESIPTDTFIDYIRGGTQLHFTITVDFARRSTDTHHPLLHRHFQMAIAAVGDIIEQYNYDKLFSAFGCGARLSADNTVSDMFHLNFCENPTCRGVDELLDAYVTAVDRVRPATHFCFSHIVKHIARIAEYATSGDDYYVLLLLTTGAIGDMRETIAAIVDAAQMPMSIIIIGIGGNGKRGQQQFEEMHRLDADRKRLAIGGRRAVRDIVQFVAFDRFVQNDRLLNERVEQELAAEVLYEVPSQLTSWMHMRRIRARTPASTSNDSNNRNESIIRKFPDKTRRYDVDRHRFDQIHIDDDDGRRPPTYSAAVGVDEQLSNRKEKKEKIRRRPSIDEPQSSRHMSMNDYRQSQQQQISSSADDDYYSDQQQSNQRKYQQRQ